VQLMRVAGDGIRDWQPLLERLRHIPHVVAASPELNEQVMVAHGARDGFALVVGILPDAERRVSSLLNNIPPSALAALQPESAPSVGGNRGVAPIVLGNELTDSIGVTSGDAIAVVSPQGPLTPIGVVPQVLPFRLVGTYHTGFYQYDNNWGYIRLADAQRLFDEPDLVSVISFKLDDLNRAAEVGRAIEQAAGKGFQTTNWMEQNKELFRALSLERIVTFIVIALIVIVAALNILIALTMMVMEKTRDIAVLMSFGVAPGQIHRIFMLQGVLIGVAGTILGVILGYVASWAGGHYHIPLSSGVYALDTLPFAPRALDGVIVAIVSIAISFLATLYPSHTASRILPAEALRYE